MCKQLKCLAQKCIQRLSVKENDDKFSASDYETSFRIQFAPELSKHLILSDEMHSLTKNEMRVRSYMFSRTRLFFTKKFFFGYACLTET